MHFLLIFQIGKSKNFDKAVDLLFLHQVSLAYSTSFSFISICEESDEEMSWAPFVDDDLNEGFISLFIHIGGKFQSLSLHIFMVECNFENIFEVVISLFIFNLILGIIKKFSPLSKALENALDNLLKASEFIPENILFNYVMQCCDASCISKTRDDKFDPLENLLTILISDIQLLQLSAHAMLMK